MTLNDLRDWFPQLWDGLVNTVKLEVAVLAVGLPAGILLALGLLSHSRATRLFMLCIVELGRGTPSLALLYMVYFGLPEAHLTLGAFTAATAALGMTTAAYTSEIFRAGFLTIPAGQQEAAASLGCHTGAPRSRSSSRRSCGSWRPRSSDIRC